MKTIEVCYSPKLFDLYAYRDNIVVVIDVLRATSSICVAFEHGVDHIVTSATIEESMSLRSEGYLVAAERNGEMIDGFDFGNSPYSYMEEKIRGSKVALTTTNGTQAIEAARKAHMVVIGSFLNQDALCAWLEQQDRSIVCLCAGWQNKFNLEDTLFAGAIVHQLKKTFQFTADCDSAIGAEHLYELAKDDLYKFLENSSHRKRLARLHIEKDIEYCLTPNQTRVIPALVDGRLINLNK